MNHIGKQYQRNKGERRIKLTTFIKICGRYVNVDHIAYIMSAFDGNNYARVEFVTGDTIDTRETVEDLMKRIRREERNTEDWFKDDRKLREAKILIQKQKELIDKLDECYYSKKYEKCDEYKTQINQITNDVVKLNQEARISIKMRNEGD